jgi:cobalamin biosynthesis protein CobT
LAMEEDSLVNGEAAPPEEFELFGSSDEDEDDYDDEEEEEEEDEDKHEDQTDAAPSSEAAEVEKEKSDEPTATQTSTTETPAAKPDTTPNESTPEEPKSLFLGRRYPWGEVSVMNPDHCDFSALRTALLSTYRRALRDSTIEVLYERYRTQRMRERRATMLATRRNAQRSPVPEESRHTIVA